MGVDWTIEANGNTGNTFRVENFNTISGVRAMVARRTGTGISKIWQSEVISIENFEDVSVSVAYVENGTLESNDSIRIEYRLNGGGWVLLDNG